MQNKFKSILVYDNKDYGWESLKKYKAFLNVTQVLLRDNDLNKNLMRYLPGMANLKCLDIFINPMTHRDLLTKLNSMPKMLSRLKTLKIEWFLLGKNSIPFSSFSKHKNVGKYLTHLSIEGIKEDMFLKT